MTKVINGIKVTVTIVSGVIFVRTSVTCAAEAEIAKNALISAGYTVAVDGCNIQAYQFPR